ncbi:MAG: tripartite tricarboxylate transporter permease [Spirochaetaceae bacterium]|jgi:putative tricarboxylic transport membrane protein|nr:tripartite tricarboxylate transporter permease [Spirochaetaceae bacterium]
MEIFVSFFQSLWQLLTPVNVLLLSLSTVCGIFIGALPGLSATMGIALLAGLTYTMNQDMALIVLMGIYVGGIYGGSISAVLIGIPGTGSAAATVLDGHPLAKKGFGREALSVTTIASFIGTLFGMLCLAALTPALQTVALKFASHEFALLAIFGVTICGSLSTDGGALKGWIAGFFGLALAMTGYEQLFSMPRFTFGVVQLYNGIAFVPAMIGLFGLPNIFDNLARGAMANPLALNSDKRPKVNVAGLIKKNLGNILRSGSIGTGIGAIPGVGEDVAAWLSYDTARRSSKSPEKFGKGSFEGIIAAECANNAAIGGALIPLLSLAIPGSPPSAVLLGALQLHGVRPGPMLTFEFPTFIPYMAAMLLLASFFMRFFGWVVCQFAPKILNIPFFILMPAVAVLSIIGAYALNLNQFDLVVMFVFGIIGFVFMKLKIPAAPIVLGLILGGMADFNFRRALQASRGDPLPFVTRPISIIVILLILFTMIAGLRQSALNRKRRLAAFSIRR